VPACQDLYLGGAPTIVMEPTAFNTDSAAAEWVKVADLKPWGNNPRKNDKAVAGVVESIRRFGFGAPVLARRANGEVIAGHTRLKAAVELGLEVVPVRYLDLDEEKAHLLAIADNKLGEVAVWDEAVLGAVVADLKQKGEDIEATGLAEHELRKLLAEDNASAADASEKLQTEPEKLREKWQTALGQVWEIPSQTVAGGKHVLLCGSSTDARSVERLWGSDRADMMWTDPPYGVAYVGKTDDALEIENDAQSPKELEAFLLECFRAASASALKPGAAVYVAHPPGPLSMPFLASFCAAGWKFRQGLVWVKDVLVLGRSDYHYRHEPILFGYTPGEGRRGRGGAGWYGGNAETSVLEYAKPKANELHPTMKPVELVARMVRNSAPQRGIVYEPFSGSGTTMLASEASSRLCRAIELDPKYVAVALERMSEIGCHGELRKA